MRGVLGGEWRDDPATFWTLNMYPALEVCARVVGQVGWHLERFEYVRVAVRALRTVAPPEQQPSVPNTSEARLARRFEAEKQELMLSLRSAVDELATENATLRSKVPAA